MFLLQVDRVEVFAYLEMIKSRLLQPTTVNYILLIQNQEKYFLKIVMHMLVPFEECILIEVKINRIRFWTFVRLLLKRDGFTSVRMLCFLIQKVKLNGKITSICHHNALLRIWNLIYMIIFVHLNNFVISLSVSHDFNNQQMILGKPKFGQILKILPKLFDRSLVLILKYIVCEFYGCTTVFKDTRIFCRNNNWNFFLQNIFIFLKTVVQT